METRNYVSEILNNGLNLKSVSPRELESFWGTNSPELNLDAFSKENVEQWAAEHTWQEIGKLVASGQSYANLDEDATTSEFFKKVMPVLVQALDKHLYEMAVAGSKGNIIFVPEVFDDTYSGIYSSENNFSVIDVVYIRTEDGKVVKTDICDEAHFGNCDASDQVAENDLLFATAEGIYYRNNSDEAFKLLENDENCSYRVLGKNAYWVDPKTEGGLYHRGANKGSKLMLRNPLSNKFEEFTLGDELERCYGQNFVTCFVKGTGEEWCRHIYKRNLETGLFEKDGETPDSECVRALLNETGDELHLCYVTFHPSVSYSYVGKLGEKGNVVVKEE